MKNVQDGTSRPQGSREIKKTKVETVLMDTLYCQEIPPSWLLCFCVIMLPCTSLSSQGYLNKIRLQLIWKITSDNHNLHKAGI